MRLKMLVHYVHVDAESGVLAAARFADETDQQIRVEVEISAVLDADLASKNMA